MSAEKKTPARKAPATKKAEPPVCNVPDCTSEPTTRGLCDPHWATHRGLADPKEDKTDE